MHHHSSQNALLLPVLAVLLPASLSAQNVFHGNGIPSAYVESTPGVVGQQVTFRYGSPTTPLPVALFAISDGIGPVFIPDPLFGNIGIDLFSPAYVAVAFGIDASGNGSLTIPLPPSFFATTPPLFAHVATFEPPLISISKTVRIEFANANGWEPVQALGTARQLHSATPLGSGPRDNVTEVLICGGATNSFVVPTPIASAELFAPLTRTVSPLPSLSLPRACHRAVRLNDRRVLVTGGVTTGGVVTATCEFFDQSTMTFVPAPSMSTPRGGHAITLLNDGRVLVTGGVADWQNTATAFIAALNTAQNTAEVFDPVTNAWTALPNMASRRLGHSQTKLADGRVLVVCGIFGGYGGAMSQLGSPGQIAQYTASCELFDPATGTWAATGSLNHLVTNPPFGGFSYVGRALHGASLLPSGNVLVTGGFVAMQSSGSNNDETIAVAFCDVWSPVTGAWTQTVDLPAPAAFHGHAPHGSGAIVSGGFSGLLTTLPSTPQVVFHDGSAVTPLAAIGVDVGTGTQLPRAAHSFTALHDGTFLVYGGGLWPNTLGDGWIYTAQ
jgi:hypothetical protein